MLSDLLFKACIVSIAFDCGCHRAITVTFIMAIAIGHLSVGRDPLSDGFGLTALVALAPILAVQVLGFLYSKKEKENEGVNDNNDTLKEEF